jgi:hypothetical protein
MRKETINMKKDPKLASLPILVVVLSLLACASPENVTVGMQAPISVAKGDEFLILATVENTAPTVQTLVSLDIGDAYLDGIAIMKTEPDNKEAFHVPLDKTMSYVFDIPVYPGDQVEIVLLAKAVRTGDFNSEIDFCINTDFSFLTKPIRTIVE